MPKPAKISAGTKRRLRYHLDVTPTKATIFGLLDASTQVHIPIETLESIRSIWPDQKTLDDLVWGIFPSVITKPRATPLKLSNAIQLTLHNYLQEQLSSLQDADVFILEASSAHWARTTVTDQQPAWNGTESIPAAGQKPEPLARDTGWQELAPSTLYYAFDFHSAPLKTPPQIRLAGILVHHKGTWRGTVTAIQNGIRALGTKEAVQKSIDTMHNLTKRFGTEAFEYCTQEAESRLGTLILGGRGQDVFLPQCSVVRSRSIQELEQIYRDQLEAGREIVPIWDFNSTTSMLPESSNTLEPSHSPGPTVDPTSDPPSHLASSSTCGLTSVPNQISPSNATSNATVIPGSDPAYGSGQSPFSRMAIDYVLGHSTPPSPSQVVAALNRRQEEDGDLSAMRRVPPEEYPGIFDIDEHLGYR